MKTHMMKVWGLLFVVLVFGFGGVGMVYALSCEEPGIASDTRECEHLWERVELPGCVGVDAVYGLDEDGRYALCTYEIRVKNYCSVGYVIEFECDGVRPCPEGFVLDPDRSKIVTLGYDSYGENEVSDKEVVMLFGFVDGLDQDELGGVTEVAGVFKGNAVGEVVYHTGGSCKDGFWDGCQMTGMGRPVGGFVGFAVMVLGGLVVWRRRVVG